MCVGPQRDAECSGETKVGELEVALAVDQQVLWLEIAMQNPILVAKRGALQKLVHEAPDSDRVEGTTVSMNIHVLLQVSLAVLEDKDKLCFGVDDIVEANDVDVLELLHERYLADGGGRRPFLCIQVDLLECDDFIGGS